MTEVSSDAWSKAKVIYFSRHAPRPGLTYLAFILSNLVGPFHPELGEETLSRQQHLCVLSPSLSLLIWSGSSDEQPSFLRCRKPNQTAKEWNFPLVQVLGKNSMSLFLETSNPEFQAPHLTLNALDGTKKITLTIADFIFFIKTQSHSCVCRVLTLDA